MRLILDEMISPLAAEKLRVKGHDVVAATEVGLRQMADAELFAWAVRERRAVVTVNYEDFRPLHETCLSRGEGHFGQLLIQRRHSLASRAIGRLVARLDAFLATHTAVDALESAEHWLD